MTEGGPMPQPSLGPGGPERIRSVLRRHPEVRSATVLGSRAKGSQGDPSDSDIALSRDIDPPRAEAIAAGLADLPLPWRFDFLALGHPRDPAPRIRPRRPGPHPSRGPRHVLPGPMDLRFLNHSLTWNAARR